MKLLILFTLIKSIVALNCSIGLNQTSNVATATLPTTLSKVLSVVGSFFNDTWYTTPGNLTVGLDNQIGSIRTFWDFTGTNRYNETLLAYNLNSTSFEQVWMGPGTSGTSIDFGIFILGTYVEYLIGQSTCDGDAVIVNFGSTACVTNPVNATPILLSNHVYGIQQIQQLLNVSNSTNCTSIATPIIFIRSTTMFIEFITIISVLYQAFLF